MTEGEAPRQRVVLHVGLHKTGTTYLQNVLRQNRQRLSRRNGVYVPGGPRKTMFASLDLIPHDSPLGRDRRVPGAWDRLAAEIAGCGLPTAVVSEERLDVANVGQARRAVSSFGDADVHVVVTVRDLARVVVAHWQEDVKNGATGTLGELLDSLQDPKAASVPPARGFWLHEDASTVLRTWSAAVPPDRVHVVTVPPAGSPPAVLTARFGSVVGFTPLDVPAAPAWDHQNVGGVGTELLRRLNVHLDGVVDRSTYRRAVSTPVVRRLATLPDRSLPLLDKAQREWAAAMAARFAEDVRKRGYHVVGDLSDLQPADPPPDTDPAEDAGADDGALLAAALEALAELATRQGDQVARSDRDAA
ncbi:MAG: hypothetical protein M3211_11785, partial [Actinomycetota bacterium]|nr:hypothetical protein [Actinomycetota bacterium]